MAGIEKVCEYSGNSEGHRMYNWKRNHIQVNPKYRKLFKGLNFKFFRFLPNHNLVNWKNNPMSDYCLYVPDLQGQVSGFYYNWTYNELGIVRRKLQRLMGVSDLDEIRIPLTMNDAWDYAQNKLGSLGDFMLECETYSESKWNEIINYINE